MAWWWKKTIDFIGLHGQGMPTLPLSSESVGSKYPWTRLMLHGDLIGGLSGDSSSKPAPKNHV